jgi:tRNA(Ile)-lysidine synthase
VAIFPAAISHVPADTDGTPIQTDEFARWMHRFAPFETRPRLVVAVSGGRDSMALAVLAHDWARACGGEIQAVTVDHGLREESGSEAVMVERWMRAHDIAHHVLRWESPEPGRASEASARQARYALLESFCREHGILHLLVGHHHADQIETHLMRRARNSGVAGLAGMAGIREFGHGRMLRPLLEVSRTRLTATLEARGQIWLEDPSNRDLQFERNRLRRVQPAAGIEIAVDGAGLARVKHDHALAALSAALVRIEPTGIALMDAEELRNADHELARDLLARVVTCVSGRVYPPRGARLDRLWGRIAAEGLDRTRTLAGCLVRPGPDGTIMVARENSGSMDALPFNSPSILWDGRFRVFHPEPGGPDLVVDFLGRAGANHENGVGHSDFAGLDSVVRMTLPGLYCRGELVARPRFNLHEKQPGTFLVRFSPGLPVAGAAFGNV